MAATRQEGQDGDTLSRDSLASGRLTAQHFLILRRLGWLLHPDIAAKFENRKDFEVVDVACGNGIWSLEMAAEYPNARFTGLDICPQQFPPQFTLPKNVSLEVHDMFQPMPDEYIERFDLVHVRMIMGAVYGQEKHWVLYNLLRLLKPGGYVQWTDSTVPVIHAVSDPLKPYSPRFRQPPAIAAPLASVFAPTEWLRHLAREFQLHGLVNTKDVDMSPVPWLSRQDTDNAIWALTDIHEGLRLRLGKAASEQFGMAVEEMIEDIRRGRVFYATYYTTIGEKPF